MNVPLLDLKAQYQTIRHEIEKALHDVIESQYFILGPKVKECESIVAEYCQCKYGVGVSSGTDALLVSLMAEEIEPDDEVITTAYSFFSTAGCVARLRAKPVFVDINPDTFNMEPSCIEKKITPRTRVILPVHLYGQMTDMDPIMEIAQRHNLVVIEDAAQALGAEYKGRRAGSIGDYGCFSFFPSKNLGCFGDGGMVTTNDTARAEKVSTLRTHGSKPKYYHKMLGGNFRLDALQAAVVMVKLSHLDDWSAKRQANARRYNELFGTSRVVEKNRVCLPKVVTDRHIFNQYVIRADRRDELKDYLKQERSIATEVYYPVPMHLQECFASLGCKAGDFPVSEKAARETLALPIYPELSDEHAQYVVESISDFYKKSG